MGRWIQIQGIKIKMIQFDMEIDDLSPYKEMSEEEFMSKLAKSREQAKQGKYREANEVVSELRTKYGL